MTEPTELVLNYLQQRDYVREEFAGPNPPFILLEVQSDDDIEGDREVAFEITLAAPNAELTDYASTALNRAFMHSEPSFRSWLEWSRNVALNDFGPYRSKTGKLYIRLPKGN